MTSYNFDSNRTPKNSTSPISYHIFVVCRSLCRSDSATELHQFSLKVLLFSSHELFLCTHRKSSFFFCNRIIQIVAREAMHGVFFFGSFYRVKITGRQATSKEAPILVLAPHSSFFDSIIVVVFGPPSVLAKAETATLPLLGSE